MLSFNKGVIAHRGASGYAPENTMAAFNKAKALNIRWIEFDVMLAKCGTPIVFHDDTLERTTNGIGDVGNYTYSELRQLDAGSWFDKQFKAEKIPTFAELLDWLLKNNMCANVEFKPLPNQDVETVDQCHELINAHQLSNSPQLLFSSFSYESLRRYRALNANANVGFLIHDPMPNWREVCDELNCISLHAYDVLIDREFAHHVKDSGRYLLSYTVNDPKHAKNLFDFGVDAVFSDFPDKIS